MPAPNTPIRIGVIGLSISGGWATTLLAPIFDPKSPTHQKYKLVALATRSAETANATAEKYTSQLGHSVKAYHGASGARELAQDPEVDVVVVAVNVRHHKDAVLPAIEAGKDVVVEWPLGKGHDEAKEIAEKAKTKGIRGMVGTQGVHTPVVRKIKEVVQSGGIGKVLSSFLTLTINKDDPYVGGEFIQERLVSIAEPNSGSAHNDVLSGHFVAGIIEALGPISSLSSTLTTLYPTLKVLGSDNKPTGQEVTRHNADQIAFSGRLASGATVTFQLITGTSPDTEGQTPFRWTINGEKGTIEVTGNSWLYTVQPLKLTVNGEAWIPDYEWDYFTGPIQRGWDEFAKGEEGDYATFDDALKVHQVVDAIAKSDRAGVRVNI